MVQTRRSTRSYRVPGRTRRAASAPALLVLALIASIVFVRQSDAPAYAAGELSNPHVYSLVTMPQVSRTTSAPVPTPTAGAVQDSGFVFGVYPGGGCGEYPNVVPPAAAAVDAAMAEIAGSGPFVAHLYTAWSWHDNAYLDDLVTRFGKGSTTLTITVKYSPPAGHDGDVAGYVAFVRSIVARYGANPAVQSFVIGNEPNVYGNKDASDGPFLRSHEAVASGVVAAADEVRTRGYAAKVGFNFAVTNSDSDAAFLTELVGLGGADFARSVAFVGTTLYPGTWRPGTGDPRVDTLDGLQSARAAVERIPSLAGKPLELREIGAPYVDEALQSESTRGILETVLAQRQALNVTALLWFDLWEANSQSTDAYAHYGLRRSDLTPQPAYTVFRQLVGDYQAASTR